MRSRLLIVAGIFLWSGCAAGRIPRPAHDPGASVEPPAAWTSATPSNEGGVNGGWLAGFNDQELDALVAEAIGNNRNLRATAARLRAASFSVTLAKAARLPSVGGGLSGSRSETAVRGNDDRMGDFVPQEDSRLSLGLSWELDVWGRLADAHRAARADYASEQADFNGARLSLAANTARAWCNLTAARQQLELAEQTRDSFDRNQRIVERNYKAGDLAASPLDVQFARNQLAAAERGLISQRLAVDEARRSLELLLGRYPAARIQGRADLPLLTNNVPAGLPSELLMRRPDLVSAAADLRASAERSNAARKGLLPSLSLTAGGVSGSPSLELLDLVGNPGYLAWNVAASLSQPVYRGGALKAQARQTLALNDLAVQNFAGLALRAFREVESALSAEQSLAKQYLFLETEVRQADLAEAQATRDYSEGIVGYLSVLEAQRRAFNSRSAMIALRNARLQTRIELFLALGGDFTQPTRPQNPAPKRDE